MQGNTNPQPGPRSTHFPIPVHGRAQPQAFPRHQAMDCRPLRPCRCDHTRWLIFSCSTNPAMRGRRPLEPGLSLRRARQTLPPQTPVSQPPPSPTPTLLSTCDRAEPEGSAVRPPRHRLCIPPHGIRSVSHIRLNRCPWPLSGPGDGCLGPLYGCLRHPHTTHVRVVLCQSARERGFKRLMLALGNCFCCLEQRSNACSIDLHF